MIQRMKPRKINKPTQNLMTHFDAQNIPDLLGKLNSVINITQLIEITDVDKTFMC